MFNKYWRRTQCDACKEWIEPGYDDRIGEENKTYHWKCYWMIRWPQKAREYRAMKLKFK